MLKAGVPKQNWFINSINSKIFLVFTAFLVMILLSAFISSRILNRKLLNNVEEIMNDTQTFVSFVLSQPEIALHLICDNIEAIYDSGEGIDAIKAYITETSSPEFIERFRSLTYYSVYGFFEEGQDFFDGTDWHLIAPPEYDPKTRPWYLAGQNAAGREVVLTSPYIDSISEEFIVSYVRRIYDKDGNYIAVICADVRLEYIDEHVINKRITQGSFGLMVDQDLRVIMHPNHEIIGELMGESNHEMRQFSNVILGSSNISMQKVTATTGRQSLVFGRQIDNGWYMIILIPEDEYYQELYQMIWIISIIGFMLALTLSSVLVKIDIEKNKSDVANRQKSAFLSTMSHEIRTPMNAILGITEILLHRENLEPSVKEALEKTYASGDMLLGIINDILDLSKIESGKMELINADYEIASLISDTAQLNMMRIGSKPIEFELLIDDNTPSVVSGDELRVKQILNNLLSNAFKYTSSGTVTMSVSSKPGYDDKTVIMVFSVSDTGQGMTEDQISKLFDEYSRFNYETNHKTEGTGLGMSITRNLIRMMGGEIVVESEPGKGSAFIVTLPQGKTGSDVLGKEMIENLLKFRTSYRAQLKRAQIVREPMPYGSVMIVDDVEMNIYVAKGLLSPYRLKMDSADSGFAAIEKIRNGNVYDIIFMDHMMPEMDGIEAAKKIREMGYERPIVALTANAVSGQAEIFLGNGFDDFISKPIDIRQLNAVLNKLIRDKHPPEVVQAARESEKAIRQADGEDGETTSKYGEIFVRDAVKSIAVIESIIEKNEYTEDDLRKYTVHMHGMKSALANLGKMELSAAAMKLEASGRVKDINVITAETPSFLVSLKALTEKLKPKDESEDIELTEQDKNYLREKLLEIKAAAENYDEQSAQEIIAELDKKKWSANIKDMLGSLSTHLLHSDFEEAAALADLFIGK